MLARLSHAYRLENEQGEEKRKKWPSFRKAEFSSVLNDFGPVLDAVFAREHLQFRLPPPKQ
jgi:hypothetical protein